MPIPPNAFQLPRPLDPSDIEGYGLKIRKGSGPNDLLAEDESVQSFTLTPTAEAVALGLTIREGGGYSITFEDNIVRFWLSIDPALKDAPAFEGAGSLLAMELSIITNSSPARHKQKTVAVPVAQQ